MRFAWAAALLVVVGCGGASTPSAAPPASSAPVPELPAGDLAIQAAFSGLFDAPTKIAVAPDGAVHFERTKRGATKSALLFDIALTADEMTDLRRRVAQSRFFDEWPRGSMITDQPTYDVTITVGALQKHRSHIYAQREFEPVERFLWLLAAQANAEDDLRSGRVLNVVSQFRFPDQRARLLRPQALAEKLGPALARCAIDSKKPYEAAEAAIALVEFASPEQFADAANAILQKLNGECRDAVLETWTNATSQPDRAKHCAAFAPIALAELRPTWRDWFKWSDRRRRSLRTLLSFVLQQHVPGALDVAEAKIREVSTDEKPFVVFGLRQIGADAVPLALRLLDDEKSAIRAAGAELAQSLALAAKPSNRDHPLSEAERAALAERLAADVVPALERRAHADGEPLFVREACFRAIDAVQGRDRYAEQRKAAADAAARRTKELEARSEAAREDMKRFEQPPTPKGDHAITGKLLGAGDTPLADFTVLARREDGPPQNPWRLFGMARTDADGAFKIDGLVEGEFQLIAFHGTSWGRVELSNNSSQKDGVRAGASDVVLRFGGSMIRGVLVGADGKPVANKSISVRMRDPPNQLYELGVDTTGWAQTDADGRFLVIQILPGVYDVEVGGQPFLRGAAGLVAGATQRRIEIVADGAVSGRVVDETGAPMVGVGVGAKPEESIGGGLVATTDAAGAFRIAGLDASLQYEVGTSFCEGPAMPEIRAVADDVAVGASDIVLRLDTSPRLALRVDFGARRASRGAYVRLVRDGDVEPKQREFATQRVLWRLAPEATWHVSAHVKDVDARGDPIDSWIELGTVKTGDPEKAFVVPK